MITFGWIYYVEDARFHGYTDTDWVGNVIDRKRKYGCFFSLISAMTSWMSRKGNSISLSIVEEYYIVTSMASCEVVWLRKLFREIFEQVLDTTMIYHDNKSGICLAYNLVFHEKYKHIKI